MYVVYILADMWRREAAFSTRDAAEIMAARFVVRGVRAKVFRSAEKQARAAGETSPTEDDWPGSTKSQ